MNSIECVLNLLKSVCGVEQWFPVWWCRWSPDGVVSSWKLTCWISDLQIVVVLVGGDATVAAAAGGEVELAGRPR